MPRGFERAASFCTISGMKTFLILLLAAAPALGADWGRAENSAAAGLVSSRAEISVISGSPLLDMLAARDKVSQPLAIGGQKFLATVVFDAAWDTWFSLKSASGPGAGAWKESDLAAGAVYKYNGLELNLKETDGVVTVASSGGESADVAVSGLFDRLYDGSLRITFGDAVTYAAFRNLEPLTETEGTATMRRDDDGVYYLSVTPDSQIAAGPRWLLAVNGVLYGLRVEDASLLFVSKRIETARVPFAPERRVKR